MKKTTTFAGILATGILFVCGLNAFGQQQKETPAPLPATAPEIRVRTLSGQLDKTPMPPGANTFTFVNSEFAFDGKPIKGAPYSAEAVTETTQVLGDGNRIVNRSTAALYRDSEGRTRREQTLKVIGGISGPNSVALPLQTVMISDPVAGVSYSLDPSSRTARKSPMGSFTFQRATSGPAGIATGTSNFVFSAVAPESSSARIGVGTGTGAGVGSGVTVATTAPSAAGGAAPTTVAPSVSWSTQPNGGGGYQVITRDARSENVNKEDLGTQTIEGVAATGTRMTFTIPPGQIGNEGPIAIVDERWFSKDLQMVVMTKHSDPRSGETVYRLTNINRSEPDHSLFEVPADYQMKEPTTLPVRTRKPE
ncbi:MAG TPA: hypothetical protein DC054_04620 [Blastocatellia bacterium]|nr:hypothetical protein [Blastocatellia bacterium]